MEDILPTQQDTLKGIEYASIPLAGAKKIATVPVYQFQQPERISRATLPFQLVLVEQLSHSHAIQPAASATMARDSWFVGYSWSIVLICQCTITQDYQHVGWKFTRNLEEDTDHDDSLPLSFYALIVRTTTSAAATKNDTTTMDHHNPLQVFGFPASDVVVHDLLMQDLASGKSKNNGTAAAK
jgi:hypothetical protein